MAGAPRTLTFVSAMSAMSALAACSPRSDPHDVAYYRAHGPERGAEMAACRNDRGRVAATPNCINALAADSEAESGRFWTVKTPTPRVVSNTL